MRHGSNLQCTKNLTILEKIFRNGCVTFFHYSSIIKTNKIWVAEVLENTEANFVNRQTIGKEEVHRVLKK
jgi:hypothetical protein